MIELIKVTRSAGQKKIIDDVSLRFEVGLRTVIVGPSGSGKTTLLRLIAGFDLPDEGNIYIDGKDASGLPPFQRNIGMVFQDLALWPHMTVKENIGFGVNSGCLGRKKAQDRIDEVLFWVGLNGHDTRYPAQLSGGEQQRVALARALIQEPRILILDEPLSDLDLNLREDLQKVILGLQRRLRMTMVFVTHNQDEAFTMGERIVVLNKGRIEQNAAADDVRRKPETEFVRIFLRIKG